MNCKLAMKVDVQKDWDIMEVTHLYSIIVYSIFCVLGEWHFKPNIYFVTVRFLR